MLPIAAIATAAAAFYAATRGPANLVSVRGPSGKNFLVQNLPDKEEAASRMERLQTSIEKLFSKYRDDPSSAMDARIQTMLQRFRPENMCENDIHDGTTSYSENKGDRIVVCLRQKTAGYPFVDENTVMFVVLHEMAHLMTTTVGHTSEFWANFRRILQDASSVQIYTPVNYAHSPTQYCGMTITDSPL